MQSQSNYPQLSTEQTFNSYFITIEYFRSQRYATDTKSLLLKYLNSLAGDSPDHPSAIRFLGLYKDRSSSTRATYVYMLNGFFKYYNNSELPMKVKADKSLPQLVEDRQIDRLIAAMTDKRTHTSNTDRGVLLIKTFINTGLRQGEMARLKVGDLHLEASPPILIVHLSKSKKSRTIPLPKTIAAKLADFARNRPPTENVFGLDKKGVSSLIRRAADRAGLPEIHTHSLRHYYATTLFRRGANPRSVQALMGHTSLETTMRYVSLLASDLKDAVDRLEPSYPMTPAPSAPSPLSMQYPILDLDTLGIQPVSYSNPPEPEAPDPRIPGIINNRR